MSSAEFTQELETTSPQREGAQTETRLRDRISEIRSNEPRNLVVMIFHQIVLRVAWIFKTESVIMPAFLDTISGTGWVRGCLPWMNRLGQSVPPMLYSESLRKLPRKKVALITTTLLMSVPFLTLSLCWSFSSNAIPWWFTGFFLLLYVFFFSMTGLNQLSFGTVQGKLIRADRRGFIMAWSGIGGSIAAITCAWIFLRSWLILPDGGYTLIFAWTGTGLVVAAMLSMLIREPADEPLESSLSTREYIRDSFLLLKQDPAFRKLVLVGLCFVTGLFLFPHYQALGRTQPGWKPTDMMIWVIAQNAGAGVFSLIGGSFADRFGNRLNLRILIAGGGMAPLLALAISESWTPLDSSWFWLTFMMLGPVPVTFRALSNYTLELTEPENHPRYLSTLKISLAVPFFLSPLVGWLIGVVGFSSVFLTMTVLIYVGVGLTFSLKEPREELDFSAESP